MEPRTLAAYVILALLAASAIAIILHQRYNSRQLKKKRQRRHERYKERSQ
jgi:hypothetical protein